MNNIVSKNITTLPSEICDIIYQYYKPQYLNDIENPFNKYCLCRMEYAEYLVRYNNKPKRIHKPTKRFSFGRYILHFDLERSCILPQNICGRWCDLKDKYYRKDLIKVCKKNDIDVKKREHTKTLIKKLMKL